MPTSNAPISLKLPLVEQLGSFSFSVAVIPAHCFGKQEFLLHQTVPIWIVLFIYCAPVLEVSVSSRILGYIKYREIQSAEFHLLLWYCTAAKSGDQSKLQKYRQGYSMRKDRSTRRTSDLNQNHSAMVFRLPLPVHMQLRLRRGTRTWTLP